MASFSVPWSTSSNGGKNMEELQGSQMNHTQSCRATVMSYNNKKTNNFVSYRLLRNQRHVNKNAQNPIVSSISSVLTNNFTGNSSSSSSSIFFPSVNGHTNKIFPTRKPMVDMEESGKLDQWVKDSVVEIVNYLDEAPFLVYIYSDGEEGDCFSSSSSSSSSSGKRNRFVKEKAFPERSWEIIKERLGRNKKKPNGIILVEEIDYSYDEQQQELEEKNNRVWGILIQGKGANYPVCYLLKTCRVASVSGFCTHFCLAKVECFVEALDLQFMKLWLS